MKNLVFTFVGLAPRFRPSRTGGPACLRAAPCSRSRFAGPGPRRASCLPALARPSLRHAATAAEKFRAHAPAFTCWCQRARSLPPAFPLLPSRAESSSSAARRAHSSAGVKLPHHRAIPRLLAPTTPPRLPSAHARACAAFRAQGELPRASPPTAMAPPCSAAMETVFLLLSSLS